MKKIYSVILISIFILGCTSCKGSEKDNNGEHLVEVSEESDTDLHTVEESGSIDKEEDMVLLEEPPALTDEDSSVLNNSVQPYAKYAEVLEQILTERSDPNGRAYEDVDNGVKFENNCFAIADIDGDGRDELIFNFNESYMASMCEVVYDYDEETDTLREELITWVDNTYYSNGHVQAMSSHNQGYDPESRGTWPYLLYEYDELTDNYQSRYYVDSWDGFVFSEGYLGEVFPSELDTDGDGLLFYIEDVSSDTEREYMNREEYEKWAEIMIPEENKIDLVYHPMTETEIENLKIE